MSYKKIAGCDIKIDSRLDDGVGIRNFKKFFDTLVNKFMKKNKKYFDLTGDLFYIYREKQLDTAIAPILDEISTAFLCEHPTERKYAREENDDDKSHGWIDYWVKDNSTIYLIELKHSYNGLAGEILKKNTIKNWTTAIEQLEKVANPKEFVLNDENVLKIALMVITTLTSSTKEIEVSRDKCDNVKNLLIEKLELNDKQYTIASIIPSKPMLVKYKYSDGDFCYPYIHVVAQII